MSLNGGGSGQLQLDTNTNQPVTRRHSSANNTLAGANRLHYAADWIRATNDSVRAYRAASLAVPSATSREERSLLDILMQQDEETKTLPPPVVRRHSTANPVYSSNSTPIPAVPPPIPSRPPPPVPERSKPPPPPPTTRVPPPVTPRTRPGPPATPPRSPKPITTVTTNFQALTDLQAQPNIQIPPLKNAHKDNLLSTFTNDITSDLQMSLRRYSQGQTEEIKIPPPARQAPFQLRKYSEGNNVTVPELTRNRSIKIPPPIQTQAPPDEDLKSILPPPQFDPNCGSCGKISMRQDSNVSSDSFSQNSSPSYTTKSMETPLLAGKTHRQARKKYINDRGGIERRELADSDEAVSGSQAMLDDANNALTKSHSTPASLQTIVRFHHGSNMSIHHKLILQQSDM